MMRALVAMLVSQPFLLGIRHDQTKRYADEGSSHMFIARLRDEGRRSGLSKKARGKRSVHNRGIIKRERPWAEEGEERRPAKRQHIMPYEQVYPTPIASDSIKRPRSWSTEEEQPTHKQPCQQEKEFQPNNLRKRSCSWVRDDEQRASKKPRLQERELQSNNICKRKRPKLTLDDATQRKIHWLIPVPQKRLRLWKQKPVPDFWEIIENLDSEDDQIRYMQDAIARGQDIDACKEIKISSEQTIHVTALNQLIYTNKAKFIEFLLKSGADVNKVSQMAIIMGMNTIRIESETPLDTAVRLDKKKIAKLLLAYQAKITQKTKSYARCYASPKLRNLVGVS